MSLLNSYPYRSSHVLALLFFLLATILSPFPCLGSAQVEVKVISPPKRASPGDFVTHVFSIANLEAVSDTFEFEIMLPEGLRVITEPTPVTLAPSEEEEVFLTIFVSSEAEVGANTVELRATSQTDPAITDSATATIEVLPISKAEVIAPPPTEAELGEEVELPFTVVNQGNTLDRFRISAHSRSGFNLRVSSEFVELLPSEHREVSATLTISEETTLERDWVTLMASSALFEGVSAEATVQVIILPLPPQAVGRTLFLEVPTELKLAVSGSISEKTLAVTESWSGGASFEENRLDFRIGISHLLEVKSLLFDLDLEQLRITLGDISLPLTEFSSVSGRGISGRAILGQEEMPLTLDLSSAVKGRDVRSAASFEANLGSATIRSALLLGSRALPGSVRAQEFLGDVSLALEPIGGLTLLGEGALSITESQLSTALCVGSSLEMVGLSSKAELIRAGTHFAGDRRDELGFLISGRLSFWGSSFSILLRRSNNNVDADPGIPTLTKLTSQADSRISLGENLPSLAGQVRFEGERTAGPPPSTDKWKRTVSASLGQALRPLSISLFMELAKDVDNVAGTDFERFKIGGEMRLSTAKLSGLFRLVQGVTWDAGSGLIVDRTTEGRVEFALRGSPTSASLSLTGRDDELGISLRFTHLFRWAELSFAINPRVTDGIVDSGIQRLILSVRSDLPIPFIKTKGQVEGFAFIDEDGDGTKDPDEEGIPKLILRIDRVRARTDEEGFYRFPPLRPGRYKLGIEGPPPELAPAVGLPLEIEVEAGEILEVDIPLVRVAAIEGVVFNDENRNRTRDAGERGIPDVLVRLTGQESQEAFTDSSGEFGFFDLLPGEYKVAIDETTLPERFELTTPGEVTVVLGAGEQITVNFGAAERPREVRIAPTADFIFSPKELKPGGTVTFDASPSFDPDGEIIRYEWDFTVDGLVDATGRVVEHSFPEPGDFPVTLTVTDNDGNKDSATKVVTVKDSQE